MVTVEPPISQHILPPDQSSQDATDWSKFDIIYLIPKTSKSISDKTSGPLLIENLKKAVHLQLPAFLTFHLLCVVAFILFNLNFERPNKN